MIVDISGYIRKIEEALQNTLDFLHLIILYVVVVAYLLLYIEYHTLRHYLRRG